MSVLVRLRRNPERLRLEPRSNHRALEAVHVALLAQLAECFDDRVLVAAVECAEALPQHGNETYLQFEEGGAVCNDKAK